MNYIKNYRVITLTLLLSLSIQGCVTSNMSSKKDGKKSKELKTQKVDDENDFDNDQVDSLEKLNISRDTIIKEIFLAIKDNDKDKLQQISSDNKTTLNDSIILNGLFSKLLKKRIASQAKDFDLLTQYFPIQNDLLEKAIEPFVVLRPKTQAEIDKNNPFKRLLWKVTKYRNINQFKCGIPIQEDGTSLIDFPTYEDENDEYWSDDRENSEYSDSEDESAPHFNGVYNLTKYGILNIDNANFPVYEGFPTTKVVNNYVYSQVDDITSKGMVVDAKDIHEGMGDHVTILCVALRQDDERIKKFLFTNQPSFYQMPSTGDYPNTVTILKEIVKRAHARDYHVIMAQQAHAEAELVQFLQERPNRYTHIISMGCDKNHCRICGPMLKEIYDAEILAKTSGSKCDTTLSYLYKNWYIPKALENALKKYNFGPIRNLYLSSQEKEILRLKAPYAYGTDYEEKHEKLSDEKWENRPWIQENHKVKLIANVEESDKEELDKKNVSSKKKKKKK